jgi:hypothetical protein
MDKVYEILFGKPRNLPPSSIDTDIWRYPFSIVEKIFVGKPDEKAKTVHSEVRIVKTGNLPRIDLDEDGKPIGVSDYEYNKIMFEHSRRFAIAKIKGDWDFKTAIEYIMSHEVTRSLEELNTDAILDPDGIKIDIETPQKVGFHS